MAPDPVQSMEASPGVKGFAIRIGILLLPLALLTGMVLYMAYQYTRILEGDARAINRAGQLRYRSHELAHLLDRYRLEGQDAALLERIRSQAHTWERILDALHDGSATDRVPGTQRPEILAQIHRLRDLYWTRVKSNLDSLPQASRTASVADALRGLVPEADRLVTLLEGYAEEKAARLRMARNALLGITVGMAALTALLVVLLIQRPLRRIAEGVREIASGNLRHRIPVTPRDMLGELAAGFNAMAEQIQRRLGEQEALLSLNRVLLQNLSPQRILEIASVAGWDILNADFCGILMPEAGGQWLMMRAGNGLAADRLVGLRVRSGVESAAGVAYTTGKPVVVPDAHRETRFAIPQRVLEAGLRSAVAVPLKVEEHTFGVITVKHRQARYFNERDAGLLSLVAHWVTLALDREQLFQQVVRAKSEWESTFDAMPDGVVLLDTGCRIRRINRTLAEWLGRDPRELVGGHCVETIHPMEASWGLCPQQEALQEIRRGEFYAHQMDREIEVMVTPLVRDNTLRGCVIGLRDVTERKRLRAQLIQSEKMSAVGQLISGVAHELNNPLTSVIGYSGLLLQEPSLPPHVQDDLRRIHQEAERTQKIVQNLLSFARQHRPEKRPVDLHELLERTLALRAYEFKIHNIQVIRDFAGELPFLEGDPHQLQQVFLNLLINAEQAMRKAHGRGTLTVRTEVLPDAVRIVMADDGPGVPPEHLNRIFEPFFTTKPVGEGTGLGLSVSYGIVQEHGGRIWAESALGRGATFVVELPRGSVRPSGEALPEAPRPPKGGGQRILVLDDEPEVQDYVRRVLQAEGYVVEGAADAQSALALVQKGDPDLILCDMKMPGMDGRAFYEALAAHRPHLASRVLFVTGDAVSMETRDFLQKTGQPHLTKPFRHQELVEAVGRFLESMG